MSWVRENPWCHVTYGPNSDWIIINWQLSNQSSIRKSRDNKVEWIYLNTKTYSVILSYQNKLGKKLKIISKKMFNPGSKNCDYPIKNSDGYYCLDYRFRELINYSIKVKSQKSNFKYLFYRESKKTSNAILKSRWKKCHSFVSIFFHEFFDIRIAKECPKSINQISFKTILLLLIWTMWRRVSSVWWKSGFSWKFQGHWRGLFWRFYWYFSYCCHIPCGSCIMYFSNTLCDAVLYNEAANSKINKYKNR